MGKFPNNSQTKLILQQKYKKTLIFSLYVQIVIIIHLIPESY